MARSTLSIVVPWFLALTVLYGLTANVQEEAHARFAPDEPAPKQVDPPLLRDRGGRDARRAPVRSRVRAGVLDLEDAIARAELILVVKLADRTEAKVVHGGKTEVVIQQFRFVPVRTLKGIFARDSLWLTAQDLGIGSMANEAADLESGQLLLLLLGRQGPGYFNCNLAGSLEQSIPRLHDQADPLLAAVEALISVTQHRDRGDKVTSLLDALRRAQDRDAAPLLFSLRRRAVIAADRPDTWSIVSRFLDDPATEIREVAARTLAELLDAEVQPQEDRRDRTVARLIAALETAGPDLRVRVALFDALGAAGRRAEPAREWLRADRNAATFAEHAARLRALGRSGRDDQLGALETFLDRLPLDAPTTVQAAAIQALGAFNPQQAARRLLARLESKSAAGLEMAEEIRLIGDLPRDVATSALLEAASRIETQGERFAFATASAEVADARLTEALGGLLDPRFGNIRWQATEALQRIDTDQAASTISLHLGEEADLLRKLQLAEFLGRHGFRSGYAYAIEHLSAPELQEAAIDALAAIQEPRTVPELKKIWEGSHDIGWSAAAIRALGRLGQDDLAPRLLELARDRKNPLAAPALIALGDLGTDQAIPLVVDGLGSRSDQVVVAATRAARKLFLEPKLDTEAGRDRLATLVVDPDASPVVREAALDSLVALKDRRLTTGLRALARDGALEGSALLRRAETLLAAHKETVEPR